MEHEVKLFKFEELSNILNLQATDQVQDELIFNSICSYLEKYLNIKFDERNYNELQTVIDCKLYLTQPNLTELINITDMNTKQKIENCVIDSDNRTVFLLTTKYNGHVFFINYNAGFTEETFPDELKDVIIRLFIIRKNNLLNGLANKETENDNCFPEDIKIICDVYKRKTL